MKLTDAARSAPVRYAVVLAALSAVAMGTLLLVIFWWTTSLLERHMEEVINQQLSILKDDLAQDGLDSMLDLVRQHAKNQNRVHILVLDSQQNFLAGDLPLIVASEGWQDIILPSLPDDTNHRPLHLRGLGTQLDDGLFILVTQDTNDLHQARRLLVLSFGITLAVTIALMLFGGLAIAVVLLRRVDDVNNTARAIMDGDLSQRIQLVGPRDELGGLAVNLNRMLSRIDELMQNLRHVTSNIAHDLRSPLSRHRQRLESARMKPRSNDEYEAAIDTAIEDTDTILKIFEAMLRIAQIEGGTPRERFTTTNLSKIAENVVDAFAAVAEDKGKSLKENIQPNILIRGDSELITQMLANLVENSLRHTPVGTNVELRIHSSLNKILITLTDDGPGIPQEEREKVFQHFYRGDTSRSTQGNGIGLSFVAAVVKLHDASISLEDNSPGLRVVIESPCI